MKRVHVLPLCSSVGLSCKHSYLMQSWDTCHLGWTNECIKCRERVARCWHWRRGTLTPRFSLLEVSTYSAHIYSEAHLVYYLFFMWIGVSFVPFLITIGKGCLVAALVTLISRSFPPKWHAFYSCNHSGSPAYNCIPSDIKSPAIHYSPYWQPVLRVPPSCSCLFSGRHFSHRANGDPCSLPNNYFAIIKLFPWW